MKRQRARTGIKWAAIASAVTLAATLTAWSILDREPSPAVPEAGPVVVPLQASADGLALPKKVGSLRFAVMGDVGRGDRNQYDTANEMARWHERFDFSLVLMLGDNIYAEQGTTEAYQARFERPYKALLDRGVTFYATLGNHDPPGQPDYVPFNMNGNRYYHFTKSAGPPVPIASRSVEFLAVDTVTLDEQQIIWLRQRLAESDADWRIAFFHHPLYTSGRYRFAAALLRRQLEPILVQYGADVALSGHEHFYERIVPQRGIQYFISGGGGALRRDDIRDTALTAAGFDQDTHFLLIEIAGDTLYFQAISRTGQTIDSGRFDRIPRETPPPVLRK